MGGLDEDAFDGLLAEDPDEALAMLADMAAATDPALRELARRLAGRISVEVARSGAAGRRGTARMSLRQYRPDGGDIDIDASLDALTGVRAGMPVDVEQLRIRSWTAPGTAWSVVVDRSGSMGGAPLATAAVAASAVALRSGGDHSVLAFSRDVVVVKSQDRPVDAERVVRDLLALRGHGTTDLASALRAARSQLDRSSARVRMILLLSDCRSTAGGDAVAAAREAIDHGCTLAVLAPAEDHEEASTLAATVGARLATVSGPSDVSRALAVVLEDRPGR